MLFEGSAVALITPFDNENKINFRVLGQLIEYQISGGTKALVVLGTTGEASTITEEERRQIIKFCVNQVGGRIPIIVGTGSNSAEIAISRSKEAEKLGTDGLLVVTPYYNKCNQQGLVEYYSAIANAVHLPVIMYNVPSRTGVNIQPETVARLSQIPNIVGIKEACGNIGQIESLMKMLPSNFGVYSGDDGLTYPLMALGANGVVSVTANCYPQLVADMCNFALVGDFKNAKVIHDRLYDINKGLFLDVNPICIKSYMNMLGFDVGGLRLPLTQPSDEVYNKLKDLKNEY